MEERKRGCSIASPFAGLVYFKVTAIDSFVNKIKRCDHRKCCNTPGSHRPQEGPAFGRDTVPSRQRVKAITHSGKMETIRCGNCYRKLAEGNYTELSIKCPRCGVINQKAKEPLASAPGAPEKGEQHGKTQNARH